MQIKFQPNPQKIIEAIVWLAAKWPEVSFLQVCKMFFFADKLHLERYGRPIIGDRYIAMEKGPVPSHAYNILKGDQRLNNETKRSAALSFGVCDEGHPKVYAKREPNLDVFSQSDIECLEEVLKKYIGTNVSNMVCDSHGNRAYKEAAINSDMDYALIIDENIQDRDTLIQEIREQAPFLVL